MQEYAKNLFERYHAELDKADLLAYLLPKMEQIITKERLEELLNTQEILTIKFGIDPTGADIHIGHLMPIMILRQFMRAGHQVHFIIGDFTAKVGDPAGRNSEREVISDDIIKANYQNYVEQIGNYLDLEKVEVHHNSTWLDQYTLRDLMGVVQKINLAEVMQRDDFRKRMDQGSGVSVAEIIYAILMGLDSVELKADIEVGGVDQLLNFQQCRKVMTLYNLVPELICTTPILEGTAGDGRKMSKSFGNYIAIGDTVLEKFGKIMSISDDLIVPYFLGFGDIRQTEIAALRSYVTENPLEMKKQLATYLVAISTNNLESGLSERVNFERRFAKKSISLADCMKIIASADNVFVALYNTGEFKSKGELLRLFTQNGVKMLSDEERVVVKDEVLVAGTIIRVGKRRFFAFVT